jgi:cytochrome c-type biogenesis protein CcmH
VIDRASRPAVTDRRDHVVGAALEHARDAVTRLAVVLRSSNRVARQLAVGDDARRPGDADVIPARPFFDGDDGGVGLDLGDEISQKRIDAYRGLLRCAQSRPSIATRVPLSAAVALTIVLAAVVVFASAATATQVSDETVHDVAGELRCVVCQNLSVADSPSEMAAHMRAIVREQLEAGETPGQVRKYFVARYGEWILLAPRRTGFNLLVWGFPIAAIVVGLVIVALLLRRLTRRRRDAPPPPAVDAVMSERIRRELESP